MHMAVLPLGEDAQLKPPAPGAKPPLVVMVLGETARADHLGLNGYARDTTPRLARENVASLRNVWSCGTNTAASVPCMFSHLGREAFESRDANTEGALLQCVQYYREQETARDTNTQTVNAPKIDYKPSEPDASQERAAEKQRQAEIDDLAKRMERGRDRGRGMG